jgi:hypothetical protein
VCACPFVCLHTCYVLSPLSLTPSLKGLRTYQWSKIRKLSSVSYNHTFMLSSKWMFYSGRYSRIRVWFPTVKSIEKTSQRKKTRNLTLDQRNWDGDDNISDIVTTNQQLEGGVTANYFRQGIGLMITESSLTEVWMGPQTGFFSLVNQIHPCFSHVISRYHEASLSLLPLLQFSTDYGLKIYLTN